MQALTISGKKMLLVLLVLFLFPAAQSVADNKYYQQHKYQGSRADNKYSHHDRNHNHKKQAHSSWSVSVNIGSPYYRYRSGYRPYHYYSGPRWPLYTTVIYPYYGYAPRYFTGYSYYFSSDRYPVHEHWRYATAEPPAASGIVSNPAQTAAGTQLFIYPNNGQSEQQASKDRYECYLWAADESGFDPSRPETTDNVADSDDYLRANSACLQARGYTVK